MYKNVASQKVAIYAWDGATGAPKTGDAGNITAQISKDGGAHAATNDANPTELDATYLKGIYIFDLTQAETNADLVVISPVSSTASVVIRPIIAYPEAPLSAVTGLIGTPVALDSGDATLAGMLTKMADDNGGADFDATTDSLEKIRAKVDALPTSVPSAADIADAAWDEATSSHVAAGSFGKLAADVLADTGELQTNQGNWLTATGFATPTDVTDAVSAIETHGDTNWLTATGFATPGNVTDAVAAVLGGIVEGTITLTQAHRIILAFIAGKATGGNTASVKFRDQADTKDRISMTVDASGNRTAVTLDVGD